MALFEVLAKITAEVIGIEIEEITPEAFFYNLGADSIDMAEIIMKTEDAFHIEIPEEDENSLKTVQNLIDYVNQHKISLPLSSLE